MNPPVFKFHATSGHLPDVLAIRGQGAPKIESGNAKWEVIDRPKRRGATQYVGSDPWRITIPLMFDFWSENGHGVWKTIEAMNEQIYALRNMQREAGLEPPKVRVIGELPVRGVKDWVVETITDGDLTLWRPPQGKSPGLLYRQDMTVQLLEFIHVQMVGFSSKNPGNSRGSQGEQPKHKSHRVKAGETLAKIAVQEYGDRKKWKAIAQAQKPPIRDPDHLKTGSVLVLP